MAHFSESVKHSEIHEREFSCDLTKKGIVNRIVPYTEDGGHFDIETSSLTTFELKNDLKSTKTGNFCIEVLNNGRKSGLSISQAMYWYLPVEWYTT